MLVVIHSEQTRREVALSPTPRHLSLFATVSVSKKVGRKQGEESKNVN